MAKTFAADDFLFPGQDGGLAYLEPPPPPIVTGSTARIRQVAASDLEPLNRKMRRRMEDRWRWPKNPPVFETLSTVVLGENVTFGQRKVQVGDRLVLSAAAGDRLWKSVLNKVDGDQEDQLVRQFARRRAQKFSPIPVAGRVNDDVPFAIDMRNGFNFYHFLTEALPQLAMIAQVDSNAPIFMHMPVLDKLKGFVTAFVRDVFPDAWPRVTFTDTVQRYDRVRMVYNHRHYLYQAGDPRIAEALADLDADDPWHAIGADRASRKFLLKSTFDTGMKALRQHALDQARQAGITSDARRIWLGRDLSRAEFKQRPNEGEDILLDELTARGFETVYLERLGPLEQIATIHAADHIVGPHGAAFSHMMFARRKASVIEIGTPQVQLHRWGDFLGNAHVSGCRYSTVFADVEGADDQVIVPTIEDGHRGIHIGTAARASILDMIDNLTDASDQPPDASPPPSPRNGADRERQRT